MDPVTVASGALVDIDLRIGFVVLASIVVAHLGSSVIDLVPELGQPFGS